MVFTINQYGHQQVTHTRFLEEVRQLIQFLITNHTNLVLLCDLDKHAQDIENPDWLVYNITMEALGLQQHIGKPMHKLGNTFDLNYKESLNRVKVLHSFIGNFISDHRVVGIELEIRKKLEKQQWNTRAIVTKRCSTNIQGRDGKYPRYKSTTRG